MGYTEIEYDQIDDSEEENSIYAMDFADAIVGAKDVANQQMHGGRVNPSVVKTAYYPSISNAQWVADIRLKGQSYPLAKIIFPSTRQMFKHEVGDRFVLDYKNQSTGERIENMIVRILAIDERSPASEDIKITCVEDIHHVATNSTFHSDVIKAAGGAYNVGMSGNSSSPSAPEAEPGETPVAQKISTLYPLNHVTVVEIPYGIANSSDLYFTILASKRGGTEIGFLGYLSIAGTTYSRFADSNHFAYCGILVAEYPNDTFRIDDTVGITFDIYNQSLANVETIERAMAFTNKHLCMIGDEFLSFETITPDALNSHRYVLTGVIRGLYGTKVATHAIGSNIWIIGNNGGASMQHESVVKGAVRRFKALPYSQSLAGSIADCAVVKTTFSGVSATPYDPVNLKVNAGRFRPTYSTGGDAVIVWTPRKRGVGAGVGLAESAIPVATPVYEGQFYVEILTGVTVKRTALVDGLTWTYTNAMMVTDFGSEPASFIVRISNVTLVETTIEYQSATVSLTVRKI